MGELPGMSLQPMLAATPASGDEQLLAEARAMQQPGVTQLATRLEELQTEKRVLREGFAAQNKPAPSFEKDMSKAAQETMSKAALGKKRDLQLTDSNIQPDQREHKSLEVVEEYASTQCLGTVSATKSSATQRNSPSEKETIAAPSLSYNDYLRHHLDRSFAKAAPRTALMRRAQQYSQSLRSTAGSGGQPVPKSLFGARGRQDKEADEKHRQLYKRYLQSHLDRNFAKPPPRTALQSKAQEYAEKVHAKNRQQVERNVRRRNRKQRERSKREVKQKAMSRAKDDEFRSELIPTLLQVYKEL